MILLWLAGGPATIDMWDNKPEAPEGIRGEFKSIDTNVKGIRVAETFPKVARSRRQAHHRPLAVPHHSEPQPGDGVHDHRQQADRRALQYPSMGSVAAKLLKTDVGVPPYVTFGDVRGGASLAGYLGTGYNPFVIEGNGGDRPAKEGKEVKGSGFSVRGLTLKAPSHWKNSKSATPCSASSTADSTASTAPTNSSTASTPSTNKPSTFSVATRRAAALDISDEKKETREKYGSTTFGQGALAARRLVEAGVRFSTVSFGGWDTHQKTFDRHKTALAPTTDMVVSALVSDLADRGLLDSTIVMVAGEFGRTPKINKNAGRDHWARSMACLLAGGGFKRGYVHGSTDAERHGPGN